MSKISASLFVAVIAFWACLQSGCNSNNPQTAIPDNPTIKSTAATPAQVTTTAKTNDGKPVTVTPVTPFNPLIYPDISGEMGGRDGAEGFNRSMATFNFFCFRWVVRPVGAFWCSIFPRVVIDSFSRFSDNVAFTRPMLSCMLQAKFGESGLVLSRFLINTTMSAGFFDPADKVFGIQPSNEDFGQAFASWGIGGGPFLTIPFIGNTNIRDGVGLIFDYAADIKTYVYGGNAFATLNKSAHKFRQLDTATRAYADPYQLSKEFYYFERYIVIKDLERRGAALKAFPINGKNNGNITRFTSPDPALREIEIPGIKRRDGYIDTLLLGKVMPLRDSESMWNDLSLWNTDFFYRGSLRSVAVIPGHDEMEYKVWLQSQKDAPLAIIIPGTGSHCTSDTAAALAEIYYDQGYSAVVMNSAMNWQFIESASSTQVPGFTPVDANDTRNAIAAVVADLEKNKERTFPKRILTGVSLGGMHTLFIAAMEKQDPKLKFDRYLAVNPPVDMLTAIRKVDECIAAWKNWPEQEFFPRLAVGTFKFMNIAPGQQKPFTGAVTSVHEQAMTPPLPGTTKPTTAAKTETTVAAKDNKQQTTAAPATVADSCISQPAKNADYLPFSTNEAKMLIGLAFKMTITENILTIHHHTDMGILKTPYTWGTRTQLYQEINEFNFEKYSQTFLVKYYSEKDKRPVTVEELNRRASINNIMPALVDNDKIRILQTGNDFLENEVDRHWLVKQFGSRCVLFRDGGHLGELYYAKVRDYIAEQSKPFAPAPVVTTK